MPAPALAQSRWDSGHEAIGDSEVDLHPKDRLVAVRVPQIRGEGDGVAEARVLPEERDLDVLRPVPVDPHVDGVEVVGPEVRVGQPTGEDPVAEIELAEPGGQLEGPQAELPASEIEVLVRLD